MAYGQTCSGKTYTMQGYDLNDKETKGIMPRMVITFSEIDRKIILCDRNFSRFDLIQTQNFHFWDL